MSTNLPLPEIADQFDLADRDDFATALDELDQQPLDQIGWPTERIAVELTDAELEEMIAAFADDPITTRALADQLVEDAPR